MVNRNLIRGLDLSEEEWEQELAAAMAGTSPDDLAAGGNDISLNQIVTGHVIRVEGDLVLIDVGYKSEGTIPLSEWEESEPPPEPGQEVKVLIEEIEDGNVARVDGGMILLSKRKAEKIEAWMKVMQTVHEGDIVTGAVTRKIKGGLLVDIGVNVFLPASQVDIRRPPDIGDYIGRTIQCVVLKIDEARRNIVVSRRALIETERAEKKSKLLAELEVGQVRKGTVKNIAEFGAFVDLGGIDGLLHITDMSWGRIGHPSELVAIDQEIEVQILHIDREREKIALGLKQKSASPWEKVEDKYPVGSRVKGTVVNVMSYGAFVKLEEGIEGLVHISEMSWTKRISHPNELVHIDDEIEVVVLGINKEKQEISLGMKQTQANPWDKVAERYPPGALVRAPFAISPTTAPSSRSKKGSTACCTSAICRGRARSAIPAKWSKRGSRSSARSCRSTSSGGASPWDSSNCRRTPGPPTSPTNTSPARSSPGTVTKLTNFGVFVGLENGLEGCCTFPSWPTTKSKTPRRSSRSANRSR